MFQRKQVFPHAEGQSFFFWGARQTGKSTLLKSRYQDSIYIDLLLSHEYHRYLSHPEQLRESLLLAEPTKPVIIDEIQKLPMLLDEIHWLIENKGYQFILSGSSPRKLLRSGANLLGGRALRYELYPLSYSEIPEFDLIKALNHGLMPRHYLGKNYTRMIEGYIGSYLEDEIMAETKIRHIELFSRFLEKAAFSNGEMVNYTNIATDCAVSSNTVKEYFSILRDTLIGNFVEPFQKKPKRRTVSTPKFYLFDVGIAQHLLKRKNIVPGSVEFGSAFEHFIYHELKTYSQYSGKKFPIYFWRTSSQLEVDFILGDHEVAIEIKATDNVLPKHTKGLRALMEEYTIGKHIIVSLDKLPRLLDKEIQSLPWNIFLDKLWEGKII
jgi:predicted AAA+ superfamily ATPase